MNSLMDLIMPHLCRIIPMFFKNVFDLKHNEEVF